MKTITLPKGFIVPSESELSAAMAAAAREEQRIIERRHRATLCKGGCGDFHAACDLIEGYCHECHEEHIAKARMAYTETED